MSHTAEPDHSDRQQSRRPRERACGPAPYCYLRTIPPLRYRPWCARLLACCLPLSRCSLVALVALVALSLLSKVPSTCCTHWRLGRQSSSVRRCCSCCWWSRHACCSSGCAIAACARPSRTFRLYVRKRDTPHASRLARLSLAYRIRCCTRSLTRWAWRWFA